MIVIVLLLEEPFSFFDKAKFLIDNAEIVSGPLILYASFEKNLILSFTLD